ncbi:MAG: TatD family hydrolase [Prolixibacteraceae bacterium]
MISIYNLMLHEKGNVPTGAYSAGLHPWFADHYSPQEINLILEQIAGDQNLIALGETGLDKICSIPMQVQQEIFEIHLKKAVEYNKPVVLHCVKAWEELIEMTSGFPNAKILHGYNGTTELTKRLLNHNFLFSIGTAILNPKAKIQIAIRIIPISSLFCETDTYEIPIHDIYAAIGRNISVKEEQLIEDVFANYSRLCCS